MIIAIPSKGRAGTMTSHNMLGNARHLAIIFCPQAEVDDYKMAYPDMAIEGVPDSIKGITKSRNWILDFAQEQGENRVIQCDDDCIKFKVHEGFRETRPVEPDSILELFEQMYVLAEGVGTNLWGFSVSADPLFYRRYQPFKLTAIIVGNLMGIIDDGQRFDENLPLKEDYDFALQSMLRHRRVLRCDKYYWFVEHQTTAGGCKPYRSMASELASIDYLQQKWGKKIIRRNKKKPYEITVYPPLGSI